MNKRKDMREIFSFIVPVTITLQVSKNWKRRRLCLQRRVFFVTCNPSIVLTSNSNLRIRVHWNVLQNPTIPALFRPRLHLRPFGW